jgi:hypothetical protein
MHLLKNNNNNNKMRISNIAECAKRFRMIYLLDAGEYYWRDFGGVRETPFSGYNKGNNNRPLN